MSLQQEILSWDKKSKAIIQSVHDRFSHDSQFLGQLVTLLETPEAQCGATWLIKHHVENGLGLPDAKQVAVILNQAEDMAEWTSRLHVLQAIHHMQIPDSSRETANRLFRSLLDDPNKFVRAWAIALLPGWPPSTNSIVKKSFCFSMRVLMLKLPDQSGPGSTRR